MLIEIFCRKRKKEPGIPVCCIEVPPEMRPRPDPSIYSQKWLMARGIAVTWENPDFRLIELSTGTVAASHALKPDTDYKIEVTVHNMSTMTAIGTTVSFQVKSFGLDGGTFASPDTVVVDIPAAGSATCFTVWHTPMNVGHICLVALLQHPDDANPMNNEGQHNTVIVDSTTSEKQIKFEIHNASKAEREYALSFDMYQLPDSSMRAKNLKERNSLGYLRRLQEHNKRVPVELSQAGFKLTNHEGQNIGQSIKVDAGATIQLTLSPLDNANGKRINIVAQNPNTGKVIAGLTVIYK